MVPAEIFFFNAFKMLIIIIFGEINDSRKICNNDRDDE